MGIGLVYARIRDIGSSRLMLEYYRIPFNVMLYNALEWFNWSERRLIYCQCVLVFNAWIGVI